MLENEPQEVRAEAEVEKWEDEEDDQQEISIFETTAVSEADKFDLAKKVLIGAVLIFVAIAVVRIVDDGDGTRQVWSFVSVAINSIVALILGYYFGRR